jgi:hypothetical protein
VRISSATPPGVSKSHYEVNFSDSHIYDEEVTTVPTCGFYFTGGFGKQDRNFFQVSALCPKPCCYLKGTNPRRMALPGVYQLRQKKLK